MKEEEKAARDAAKKIHTDDNNANEYEQLGFDAGWNAAIAYAKREQQWIPVGERLPETNGFYLVTIPVGDGEFDTQVDAWSVSRQEWTHYRGIRAWCDLPAPYQPKTDGADLTIKTLGKMTPTEITALDWADVRRVLSGETDGDKAEGE